MAGHPFPEIFCKLCNKPVDLTADLSADENGKAVHENCYVRHITNQRANASPADLSWRLHMTPERTFTCWIATTKYPSLDANSMNSENLCMSNAP